MAEHSAKKDPGQIILRPHITEKASGVAGVFQVAKNATKPEIAKAIKELYKVTPIEVRITNIPARRTFVRGKWGMKSGIRKATVVLKKGETIEMK